MKRLLISAILMLSGICSFAQAVSKEQKEEATVYGTVKAEVETVKGNLPLAAIGAVVQLYVTDGDKVDSLYTTTDTYGRFMFKKIRPQEARLRVRLMGYVDHDRNYALEAGANAILINLKTEKMLLEEARVTAEMALSRKVKDTTIFNAAAVHTLNDESARAILEQLPGFQIKGESIMVDGKEVSKTYVNGVLIFGDSPMTAVSSLKADEVREIKVYEELSAEDRRRGLRNAQKQKVLDIITKEAILSMTEASVVGAVGIDGTGSFRGHGAAAVTFNSEMTNWMAGYRGGNIDQSGLGSATFSSAVGFTRLTMLGSPYTENSMNQFVEIRGEKHFKNREYGNTLTGEYTFGHVRTKSAERALTDYFETASSPQMAYEDTTSSLGTSRRHSFNLGADLKDTPLKSIGLGAHVRIDEASDNASHAQRISTSGVAQDVYSRTMTENTDHDIDFYTRLGWTNNDLEKFRPFLNATFNFSDQNGNGWTLDTLASSHTRRQLQSERTGRSTAAMFEFGIDKPLINTSARTLRATLSAIGSYDNHTSRQMSYDLLGVTEPIIDPGMSYDYSWNAVKYGLSGILDYASQKTTIAAMLEADDIINMDRESYPSVYDYDRSYFTINPSFSLFHTIDDRQRFQTTMNAYGLTPSREQTRDRISDANPLALTGGNKDLEQSYLLTWFSEYGISSPDKAFGLRLQLLVDMTFGQIVTKTTYFNTDTVLPEWDGYVAKAGAMLHTFENSSSPSYRININSNISDMFFQRRLQVSTTPNWVLSYSPQYVGNDLIGIKTTSAGLNTRINWSDGNNKISLLPDIGWSRSTNDSGLVNTEAISYSMNLNARRNMLKNRLFVGGGYSVNGHRYISSAGRDNVHQNLFLHVGGKFFKNSLRVVLNGGDLLSSGSNYSASESALAFSQKWRPSYGRYLVLSVDYRFRKKN